MPCAWFQGQVVKDELVKFKLRSQRRNGMNLVASNNIKMDAEQIAIEVWLNGKWCVHVRSPKFKS